MKGKKSLILASIFAGVGLVGATFAAWAVTDNADPFGVRITPGSLPVSDTGSVTLDWGSTRTLADIEGIQMGETKGPYTVGVKASTDDAESFKGKLSATLTTTATGSNKLIDHITVDFYEKTAYDAIEGTDKSAAKVMAVPHVVETVKHYDNSVDKTVTSGTEFVYYVTVTMEAGLDPLVYNAIKDDIVTVTLDWGVGSGIDVATTTTYYYQNSDAWGKVYAYAWNSTTGAQNAEYPGVEMTVAEANILSVELENSYNKVIFNAGKGDEVHKTANLDLSASNPFYRYQDSAWGWGPAPAIGSTTYSLVGSFNEWVDTANPLVADTSEAGYTYSIKNISIPAGALLKVKSSTNVWYGENGTTSDNMSIGEAGTYNFFFNPLGNDGVYILCQPVS